MYILNTRLWVNLWLGHTLITVVQIHYFYDLSLQSISKIDFNIILRKQKAASIFINK